MTLCSPTSRADLFLVFVVAFVRVIQLYTSVDAGVTSFVPTRGALFCRSFNCKCRGIGCKEERGPPQEIRGG